MVQVYNGVRFYLSKSTGYWERSRGVPRKLHVYIWECANGRVPINYCIHHIDFNKDNNTIENLQLLTLSAHANLHDNIPVAREASKEWHGSEIGLEWHKQHGKDTAQNWKSTEYKCEQCGVPFTRCSPRTDYRFCSNACRSKCRREAGIDDEPRTCAKCGSAFSTNKYKSTICCSKLCASQLRWDKKHS